MNKKINLAVAGAALALGASAANAGIVIPAGDWTLDVNGNVNAFMNFNDADAAKGSTLTGNIANGQDGLGESDSRYQHWSITIMVRIYWYNTSKQY